MKTSKESFEVAYQQECKRLNFVFRNKTQEEARQFIEVTYRTYGIALNTPGHFANNHDMRESFIASCLAFEHLLQITPRFYTTDPKYGPCLNKPFQTEDAFKSEYEDWHDGPTDGYGTSNGTPMYFWWDDIVPEEQRDPYSRVYVVYEITQDELETLRLDHVNFIAFRDEYFAKHGSYTGMNWDNSVSDKIRQGAKNNKVLGFYVL